MSKSISFTIFGNPVPAGRPRFAVIKGHAIAYLDKKTKAGLNDFKLQALQYKPAEPLTGPLSVTISVYRKIPKSFSKKKHELAEGGKINPISRPDLDNYIVLCFNSMSGIFFADDSQICQLTAKKLYSSRPRIEVSISEMTEA